MHSLRLVRVAMFPQLAPRTYVECPRCGSSRAFVTYERIETQCSSVQSASTSGTRSDTNNPPLHASGRLPLPGWRSLAARAETPVPTQRPPFAVPPVLFLRRDLDDRYANTVALRFGEIEDLLDRI